MLNDNYIYEIQFNVIALFFVQYLCFKQVIIELLRTMIKISFRPQAFLRSKRNAWGVDERDDTRSQASSGKASVIMCERR